MCHVLLDAKPVSRPVTEDEGGVWWQVIAAFKILTSDHQVKALLVNIFGAFPSGRLARPHSV